MSWPSWSSVSSLVSGRSPLLHRSCKGAECGDTSEMHHLTQTPRCFTTVSPTDPRLWCCQSLYQQELCFFVSISLCWRGTFGLLSWEISFPLSLFICLLNKPHITSNVIFPGILDVSWLVSPLSLHFIVSQALSSRELQTVSEHVYTGHSLNGTWELLIFFKS